MGCLGFALVAWGIFVHDVIMPPVSEALEVPEGYTLFFLLFIGVPVLLFIVRVVFGLATQRERIDRER